MTALSNRQLLSVPVTSSCRCCGKGADFAMPCGRVEYSTVTVPCRGLVAEPLVHEINQLSQITISTKLNYYADNLTVAKIS